MPQAASAIDVAIDYHDRTKHHLDRYARSLGYMDWDTQPDPFRRYDGAELILLDEVPPTAEPGYDAMFEPGRIAPGALNRGFVSQFFYDCLAISAWKEFGRSRWALRCNPSSGNLHPTEGYLIAGPIDGLRDEAALYHYQPFMHGLELRRTLPGGLWRALARGLPEPSILIGLSSIYWRESWKYGERGFRYCQHDVGHAIGAIALAAAALGWRALLLEAVTDSELAILLGIADQRGIEAEHADCMIALYPHGAAAPDPAWRPDQSVIRQLSEIDLIGKPNQLSATHHDWPIINEVAAATTKSQPLPPDEKFVRPTIAKLPDRGVSARQIIRQRRSAVAMDGRKSISRSDFYRMLIRTMPAAGHPVFDSLPWRPCVHLGLFVHRVRDVSPGVYVLVRDVADEENLHAAIGGESAWTPAPDLPPGLNLRLLQAADCRDAAQAICCHQEIAADGVFALGMIARFEPSLRQRGAPFYKRLFWETGAIGQVLYLEAEAAGPGIRSTGIGCFFDDPMHEVLGLEDRRYQSLYHFTVGGVVEDLRLRTWPAYAHRVGAIKVD